MTEGIIEKKYYQRLLPPKKKTLSLINKKITTYKIEIAFKKKTREYPEQNQDRIRERTKDCCQKNRDHIREWMKDYRQLNQDRLCQ